MPDAPSTAFVIAAALAGMALLFAAAYVFARRVDNYGIVDVVWSGAFTLVALGYASFLNGEPTRRWVIAIMATVWSLRLALHLGKRVYRSHPEEDGRYQQLRRDWGANFARKMFGFFQLQGISVILLATPFLLASSNPEPRLQLLEWLGLGIAGLALIGETVADAQLAAFKRDTTNKDKVCDRGLWGYSRHPNYFFEWLIWVGFALFALASPSGWLAVICPVIMYYLLTRVTGVRYTEEQLARSKGPAYREYQRRTSAFFPWAPKH